MWTAQHIITQPKSTNLVKAEVMAHIISANPPYPVKTRPNILNELFSVIGIGAYFLFRETR